MWIISLLLAWQTSRHTTQAFSLALYNGGSLFFEPVYEGWFHQCKLLGITCYASQQPDGDDGPPRKCFEYRREQVEKWMDMGVSGIALKPCSEHDEMRKLFDEAKQRGVFITLLDGDVANSSRMSYVGTDNAFMGRTMAKLLRQLRPEGGNYTFVGFKDPRNRGFVEEITRYNHRDDRAHWYEMEGPTHDHLWAYYRVNNETDSHPFKNPPGHNYMPVMERAAALNPTAMIFMKQTPMRHENCTNFVDRNRHKGIIYIGTDGADFQLAYLNSRYVDGLVGQMPYEMGLRSAHVLYDLVTTAQAGGDVSSVAEEYIATNIVAYNLIPLELPELEVDENLIGSLEWVGYVCFGIVLLSIAGCLFWTYRNRTSIVVSAAQPFFLVMVAIGVLIMSGSLIPLTFDDGGGSEDMSHAKSVVICMSVPWFAFTGFTITFSALFSKLWRVNKLFHLQNQMTRIRVSEYDVLPPFLVLLSCNFAVLICWTIIDPLKYQREEHEGTDYWNRVISTYGSCRSENVLAYLVPLALINFFVLVIASWQAIKARNLKSEFSEAKYVGLAVGGLFQAFLTGIPVVVVAKGQPSAYYLILTMVIFLVCEGLLILIFVPKIWLQRDYAGLSREQQKRLFESRIREISESVRDFQARVRNAPSSDPVSSDNVRMNNSSEASSHVATTVETYDSGSTSMEFRRLKHGGGSSTLSPTPSNSNNTLTGNEALIASGAAVASAGASAELLPIKESSRISSSVRDVSQTTTITDNIGMDTTTTSTKEWNSSTQEETQSPHPSSVSTVDPSDMVVSCQDLQHDVVPSTTSTIEEEDENANYHCSMGSAEIVFSADSEYHKEEEQGGPEEEPQGPFGAESEAGRILQDTTITTVTNESSQTDTSHEETTKEEGCSRIVTSPRLENAPSSNDTCQ